MALLSRAKAKAASAEARRQTSPSGESRDASPDVRMPKRFVGMAGVYDIAKHFEYESLRGVEVRWNILPGVTYSRILIR